jgi:hypothetical protein
MSDCGRNAAWAVVANGAVHRDLAVWKFDEGRRVVGGDRGEARDRAVGESKWHLSCSNTKFR